MNEIFTSKADVLKTIQKKIKNSKIEKIFDFNKFPEELSVTKSPFLEIARAKKFCVLINEDIERLSQTKEPLSILKQTNLLSWFIK